MVPPALAPSYSLNPARRTSNSDHGCSTGQASARAAGTCAPPHAAEHRQDAAGRSGPQRACRGPPGAQPPATAGITETWIPAGTSVSSPCARRTSSSPT